MGVDSENQDENEKFRSFEVAHYNRTSLGNNCNSLARKKIEIDEKLAIAQAMKAKAMDAMKMSGQKQKIKLTLKGSSERAPQPVAPSRKRVAESPASDDVPAAKKKSGAPASRREELLKQLKAVEDAIARKRSKT